MFRTNMTQVKVILVFSMISIGVLTGCLPCEAQPVERVVYGQPVVVAAEPHAVQAGLKVLRDGGNAVDAAVAIGFVLAVTYPQAGNIGGGGFLLVAVPDAGGHRVEALDFRETAPGKATPNMYLDEKGQVVRERSLYGYLAVGVPGTVRGLWELHQRYGSLPWPRLLRPAIELASRGFAVPSSLYRALWEARDRLTKDPAFRSIFFEDGRPRQFLKQTDLAGTLGRIATQGADGFYHGYVAHQIEKAMIQNGGLIRRQDLDAYRAIWRTPIEFSVDKYKIATFPPPSAGGWTLAFTFLGMKSHRSPGVAWHSLLHINLITELWKVAYNLRTKYFGDPDRIEIPQDLFDPVWMQKRGEEIRPLTVLPLEVDQIPPDEGTHTTHYAVIDREGMAVSVTYTLNSWFGAGVVVPGTGIILNNEMDDFSSAPGVPNQFGAIGSKANAIEPGKRMLSSMTPTLVFRDGKIWGAIGAPGGTRIPTAVYQVLENLIIYGMSPDHAVRAPRFHHQRYPDRLFIEEGGIGAELVREARGLGYRVEKKSAIGRVYLIWREGEGFWGVADPRGPGVAGTLHPSGPP